jgi:cyclopropane fatty-acyl-phospholipid synthase-like methyltransferase
MLNKKQWDAMHERNYHPPIDDIIKRISNDINGTNGNPLFVEWSEGLKENIDVKNKSVLEIGHGGGWYLAQMIRSGAKNVIGIEINDHINFKANQALHHFNINNFKLYSAKETGFTHIKEKVDIIYSITVFQHTDVDITKAYLLTSKNILNESGCLYLQFYLNETNPSKSMFAVKYTQNELLDLFDKCGLKQCNFYDLRWDGCGEDYWRIYKLMEKK